MIKHYKSKSTVSINAVLKSKKSVHIAFTAQSDGSSVYVTDNEEIQYALEHHHRFGKLFKLIGAESQETGKENSTSQKEASDGEPRTAKVEVSDLSEAKNYLAETFGISRTVLRNKESIISAAKAKGIVFEGI